MNDQVAKTRERKEGRKRIRHQPYVLVAMLYSAKTAGSPLRLKPPPTTKVKGWPATPFHAADENKAISDKTMSTPHSFILWCLQTLELPPLIKSSG